jgi:hypothetical protein
MPDDMQELSMFHCSNCGNVKAFKKDDPRVRATRCKDCLQGEFKPVAINFVEQTFETPK